MPCDRLRVWCGPLEMQLLCALLLLCCCEFYGDVHAFSFVALLRVLLPFHVTIVVVCFRITHTLHSLFRMFFPRGSAVGK